MFVRIGRIVLNTDHVTKVVRDGNARKTTVYLVGGNTAEFTDHFQEAWLAFKHKASEGGGTE
jgi:glucose-6-phosphate isomerase